jgi:hypothetical protein
MRLGNIPATCILLFFGVRAAVAEDVVIAGTVVNGLTGDPIPRASVALQGFAEDTPGEQPSSPRMKLQHHNRAVG